MRTILLSIYSIDDLLWPGHDDICTLCMFYSNCIAMQVLVINCFESDADLVYFMIMMVLISCHDCFISVIYCIL